MAQVYPEFEITLLQDNLSAVLLEKNGINSSGKRTRHLGIRAFWIADQAKKDIIAIEHESKENMIADFALQIQYKGQSSVNSGS